MGALVDGIGVMTALVHNNSPRPSVKDWDVWVESLDASELSVMAGLDAELVSSMIVSSDSRGRSANSSDTVLAYIRRAVSQLKKSHPTVRLFRAENAV